MLYNYTKWPDFCDFIKSKLNLNYTNEGCHSLHYGLSIDSKLPFSISEYEFNYMKEFILQNNLKNGFELATGIGVSTIALGYSLGLNGGKLLSVDSYLEEETQNQPIGMNEKSSNNIPYLNNKNLLQIFEVSDNVILKKGISPIDCINFIKEYFSEKLDFVFLDCPKSYSDYVRDIEYVYDFLNKERFAIFVHDTHCFMEQFRADCVSRFGIESRQLTNFNFKDRGAVTQHFPLSIITNI